MAERVVDVLIIGAGVAGAACAKELRDSGFTGSIELLGRELDAPYERPPGTKDYLAGKSAREDSAYLPADWYERNDVQLRLRTSVMKLDTAAKTAAIQGGDVLTWGSCVVATGANVRRLQIEGTDLEGLHYIRALRNADTIRRELDQVERAATIGGSYIGCEVAATLTDLGKQVTVVMMEAQPMQRGFGEQVGAFLRGVLESHGVTVLGDQDVDRLEGDDERVEKLICKDGTTVDAQLVVLGVGAVADVMVAKNAGLELGPKGGVLTDEPLRTSAPDVYAIGDCSEFLSPLYDAHLRIEHHEVAIAQGKAVAKEILGVGAPFDFVPYFWSDLSDWLSLEYVGHTPAGWDQEIIRGSIDDAKFSVWYIKDDRLVAVLSIGRGEDLDDARRLISAGGKLAGDHEQLADLASELSSLS